MRRFCFWFFFYTEGAWRLLLIVHRSASSMNKKGASGFCSWRKSRALFNSFGVGASGSTAGGVPSCFVNALININCAALANAFYNFTLIRRLHVMGARCQFCARSPHQMGNPDAGGAPRNLTASKLTLPFLFSHHTKKCVAERVFTHSTVACYRCAIRAIYAKPWGAPRNTTASKLCHFSFSR